MKKKTYLIIFMVLITALFVTTFVNAEQRQPRLNFNGYIGNSFTGQATVLYPFSNKEDSLFYTDLRGMFSKDSISKYNLGLGYRK